MHETLVVLNELALFMFASMYFGTGWSTVLFSFPVTPKLTVDNYYLHFVPQVKAAVRTFTIMTTLMLISAGIMVVNERDSDLRWVPIVVGAFVIASTTLTVTLILPINRRMAEGIRDPDELKSLLRRWTQLTLVRVVLWTGEWLALATFFGVRARR